MALSPAEMSKSDIRPLSVSVGEAGGDGNCVGGEAMASALKKSPDSLAAMKLNLSPVTCALLPKCCC
eukprot:4182590-Karenia_brevis.AAC.1